MMDAIEKVAKAYVPGVEWGADQIPCLTPPAYQLHAVFPDATNAFVFLTDMSGDNYFGVTLDAGNRIRRAAYDLACAWIDGVLK